MSRPIIKNILCGVVATGVSLSYAHIGKADQIAIEKNYTINDQCAYLPDEYNQYYSLLSEEQEAIRQIEISHEFVSNLIENSEDLDPNFAKTVSKHFWNLA